MAGWRKRLFMAIARNATDPVDVLRAARRPYGRDGLARQVLTARPPAPVGSRSGPHLPTSLAPPGRLRPGRSAPVGSDTPGERRHEHVDGRSGGRGATGGPRTAEADRCRDARGARLRGHRRLARHRAPQRGREPRAGGAARVGQRALHRRRARGLVAPAGQPPRRADGRGRVRDRPVGAPAGRAAGAADRRRAVRHPPRRALRARLPRLPDGWLPYAARTRARRHRVRGRHRPAAAEDGARRVRARQPARDLGCARAALRVEQIQLLTISAVCLAASASSPAGGTARAARAAGRSRCCSTRSWSAS